MHKAWLGRVSRCDKGALRMDEGERISVVAWDLDVSSFLNAALEES